MRRKRNFYIPLSAALSAWTLLLASFSPHAGAQSSYAGQFFPFREGIVNDGSTAIGTPYKGFFASVPTAITYDSQSGWADMAMPALSYHFRPSLSMDMSLPVYLSVNAVQESKTGGMELASHSDVLGDMAFAGHYTRTQGWGAYTLTGATSAPVGDKSLGLSAGRMTGSLMTHFAREFRLFDGDADAGFGDSSNLVRESARKNYTSLGKLIFVQAGGTTSYRRTRLSGHFYDQLPMGNQTVFTSVLRKNMYSTVLFNTSDAKDYGVSLNADLAVTPKLGLSANYSYSAPLHDSAIGMSLTVLLFKPIQR